MLTLYMTLYHPLRCSADQKISVVGIWVCPSPRGICAHPARIRVGLWNSDGIVRESSGACDPWLSPARTYAHDAQTMRGRQGQNSSPSQRQNFGAYTL